MRGHALNHKRVARVVRTNAMGIKQRRHFVRTPDSKHDQPIFPYLYRNVIPSWPNLVWVADIIYISLGAGFCSLAAILDACSHKVGDYAIPSEIDTQHTLAALDVAIDARNPLPGCIHYSDWGVATTD
jgi:putative transposase